MYMKMAEKNVFQSVKSMCKCPRAKKNIDDLSNGKSRMAGVQVKRKKLFRFI